MLLIRDTLRIIPIPKETSSCDAFNVCAIQLPAPARKTPIASVYRAPWASADETNRLFNELNSLCSTTDDQIIMGDFNLPNVDWTHGLEGDFNSIEYQLKSFMCEYDLQQINTSVSRGPNILDSILASPHYVTGAVHQLQLIVGYNHNVQRLCIPFSNERLPRTTTRIDFPKLIASLSLIDWNMAFAGLSDVDDYAICFHKILQDSLNQAKYTSTCRSRPNLPKHTLKLIHVKRHLRGSRYNSGQDGAFRAARNRVRAGIRKFLVHWESALFKSRNHRNFFAYLNGRLGRNQSRSAKIALQDCSLSEANIAAMFSKEFASNFNGTPMQNADLAKNRTYNTIPPLVLNCDETSLRRTISSCPAS